MLRSRAGMDKPLFRDQPGMGLPFRAQAFIPGRFSRNETGMKFAHSGGSFRPLRLIEAQPLGGIAISIAIVFEEKNFILYPSSDNFSGLLVGLVWYVLLYYFPCGAFCCRIMIGISIAVGQAGIDGVEDDGRYRDGDSGHQIGRKPALELFVRRRRVDRWGRLRYCRVRRQRA